MPSERRIGEHGAWRALLVLCALLLIGWLLLLPLAVLFAEAFASGAGAYAAAVTDPDALAAVRLLKTHSDKSVERALANAGERATGHEQGSDAG